MVNSSTLQMDSSVSKSRKYFNVVLQLIRRPLLAYIIISICIGLGFHELEQHTDRQLIRAIKVECRETNKLREQFNIKFTPNNPIELTDCNRVPKLK